MKKSSTPTKRKAATVTAPKAKKVTASTIIETVIAPEPIVATETAEVAAPATATEDNRYFAPVFNTRISGSPFRFAKPFQPVWLPAARKN